MDSLGQFGLRDVVDVLIVAYVLYRGMLLIRGTRAVRMALGLLLMFVAYIAARELGLRTVDIMKQKAHDGAKESATDAMKDKAKSLIK